MPKSEKNVFDFHLADGRVLSCALDFSARAGRVLLKFSAQSGLRLVWPAGAAARADEARDILEKMRPWIERQAAKAQSLAPREEEIPGRIDLALSGEVWPVIIEAPRAGNKMTTLEAADGRLLVRGHDKEPLRLALREWLFKKAKARLPLEAARLGARLGFSINKIFVKRQKTRWGSCSARGNINLNYRLMLLPPELAYYVMCHEFCHLRHMNHGEEFRRLLASFYPAWRELDRKLRLAGRELPSFF